MAPTKTRVIPDDDQQPDLSPEMHWMRKGAVMRALLNRAIEANRLSHEFLARETGIDERQIGRCLTEGGGAHPPLALVACVLWHDKAGILIRGLAEMLSYEVKPKLPDPYDRIRKLETALAQAVAALQEATR